METMKNGIVCLYACVCVFSYVCGVSDANFRYETVNRVVEGTFTMQKNWVEQHQMGWDAWKAQQSAQEMYKRIFHMKFLPPGRGTVMLSCLSVVCSVFVCAIGRISVYLSACHYTLCVCGEYFCI